VEEQASNFILKERFRNTSASQPVDTLRTQQIDQVEDVEETTIECFEVGETTNAVRLRSQANPGTVGTLDEDASSPLDPCPSKSATGNRVEKAQFSRRRTHNEQTLVCPCGIIFAHATMFGAEAVSNFLVCPLFLSNNNLPLLTFRAGDGPECLFGARCEKTRAHFL